MKTLAFFCNKNSNILYIGESNGSLSILKNKIKNLDVFEAEKFTDSNRKLNFDKFFNDHKISSKKYDIIILNLVLGEISNINETIEKLKSLSNSKTRVIVYQFNYHWSFLLNWLNKMVLKLFIMNL